MAAAHGSNSLMSSGGLHPGHSPQQSPKQHFAMYSANLLPVQPSSVCLSRKLEDSESDACDAFCQPLHQSFLTDFRQVPELHNCASIQQLEDLNGHLISDSAPVVGGNVSEDRLSARKVHKADREKLRRDRLNEHFSELASILDPERPKNDKATILGESVQVVKELQSELKRLKAEHSSLLNESRDLTQEKNELREEKAVLKNETEQMQSQLQQRIRAMPPWMTLDPSAIMGAAAFPYPVPLPHPISLPSSDSHQMPASRPLISPTPYIPFPPPLGAFPMHPNLQAFAMFGGRHGDGNSPYLPYPTFPPPVGSHSHVERPYAQYPSSVQPFPGYAVQMQPGQGTQHQVSTPSQGTPVHRPCVPGIPVFPPQQVHLSSPKSKAGNHHSHATQGNCQHVPDLQTPVSSAALNCLSQPVEGSSISGARSEPSMPEIKEGSDSPVDQQKINSSISTITHGSSKEGVNSQLNEGISSSLMALNTNLEQEHTDSGVGSENRIAQTVDLSLHPPAA